MSKTYDPGKVICIWGAITFVGFVEDGDAISVAYDEDHVTKRVGLTGEVVRSINRNRTGKVTLRLLASSMSNDLMSAAANLDRLDGSAVFPFLLKDLSGLTLIATPEAWIMKTPGPAFGKEIGTREWVLDCGQLEMFNGGILG